MDDALPTKSHLERLITRHAIESAGNVSRTRRWISTMALVQALQRAHDDDFESLFVVKGGTAIELRLRQGARMTRDVDATYHGTRRQLGRGWSRCSTNLSVDSPSPHRSLNRSGRPRRCASRAGSPVERDHGEPSTSSSRSRSALPNLSWFHPSTWQRSASRVPNDPAPATALGALHPAGTVTCKAPSFIPFVATQSTRLLPE